MHSKQIYGDLSKALSVTMGSIMDYINQEQAKPDNSGFITSIGQANEADYSYKIFGYTLLIKMELKPFTRTFVIRTYEIIDSIDSYPSSKKLVPLSELDIVGYYNSHVRFVHEKKEEIFNGNFINSTVLSTSNGGSEYFKEVLKLLRTRETEELKKIENTL